MSKDWILVTGMIRSGTTVLGKVISLPLSVAYIHEPFNSGYSLPDNKPFQDRYFRPYDESQDAAKHKKHVSNIFNYNFKLQTHKHPNDSLARKAIKNIAGSRGSINLRIAKINPFLQRSLIKDPKAILSAEFLYLNFNIKPVIIVRHPVSLAASLQRVGWFPDMEKFLNDPLLIEDYFSDDIHLLEQNWSSPMLESMAHWRATYRILLSQAAKYPDWEVVTHEDFCESPLYVTKQLYDNMDLNWSMITEYRIRRLTSGTSAEPSGGQVMDLNRNSADIFKLRRDSIPRDMRNSIYHVVKDVALQIYSRESFNID